MDFRVIICGIFPFKILIKELIMLLWESQETGVLMMGWLLIWLLNLKNPFGWQVFDAYKNVTVIGYDSTTNGMY